MQVFVAVNLRFTFGLAIHCIGPIYRDHIRPPSTEICGFGGAYSDHLKILHSLLSSSPTPLLMLKGNRGEIISFLINNFCHMCHRHGGFE